MNFYLWQEDEQKGPFTLGQLRSMWQNGQITVQTLYWTEGAPAWLPLSHLQTKLEVPDARPPSIKVPDTGAKECYVRTSHPLGCAAFFFIGLGIAALLWGFFYGPSVIFPTVAISGGFLIVVGAIVNRPRYTCSGCGNKVERSSRFCPACRTSLN